MNDVKASDVIQGVLDRLDRPEGWWKGSQKDLAEDCVLMAAGKVEIELFGLDPILDLTEIGKRPVARMMHFVHAEIDGRDIAKWNDDPATSFEDMRLTLKRAKARAEEAGE